MPGFKAFKHPKRVLTVVLPRGWQFTVELAESEKDSLNQDRGRLELLSREAEGLGRQAGPLCNVNTLLECDGRIGKKHEKHVGFMQLKSSDTQLMRWSTFAESYLLDPNQRRQLLRCNK